MDSTVFGSQLLHWSYLVVGGIGLAFYLYRELLARHVAHTHDYEVSSVEPIDDASYEIWLRPLGERFAFRPGQFALVNLEARDGWHRHPFTIASGPQEREVRITVRALGDFTSSIGELVRARDARRHQQPAGALRLHARHRAPGVGRRRYRHLPHAQLAPVRPAR